MLEIRARFERPRFSLTSYRRALDRAITETLSRAAFEYIVSAVEQIPVWSGASRATFTQLASIISAPLSINPVVQSGVSRGASQGSGGLEVRDGRGSFVYQTTLPHLVFNESNDGNSTRGPGQFGTLRTPGPYNFQEIAGGRAEDVLNQFRGPDPSSFTRVNAVDVRLL